MNNQKLLRVFTSSVSYGLVKGQLRFLTEQGWEVVGVSGGPQERSEQAGVDEGIRTLLIPNLVRPISLKDDVRALFQLRKVIKAERPDIMHANTPKGSLLGMVVARWCGVPHRIYTVTGLRFETTTGFKRWLLITMERIACYAATKIIPEGEGVKATLLKERITSKPLQILHNGNINGIDLHHFARTPEVMEETNKIKVSLGKGFNFIFIGRIVRDKGIIELVEAFIKLNQEYTDVNLILVGALESELDPLPETTLNQINTHKRIHAVGFQKDIRAWLAVSNALVFPSYREGFPNVVLQAGAMGLPSVVTNINGCNEIIIEGKNGYIIPSKDVDALYKGMKRLLLNESEREKMAAQARDLISSRYKQEDVWLAIHEMYEGLDS